MPYNVLVNIFVFSAYFSTVVIPNGVEGQARWSFITAAGAIIVALTAPVLGAIADAGGRRKPWLAATYVIGVPAMMLLWFAKPGMTDGLVWIGVAVILGNLFYEYSQIFANAMLPNIVPPERIGFLSGAGLPSATCRESCCSAFSCSPGAGIQRRCSASTRPSTSPSARSAFSRASGPSCSACRCSSLRRIRRAPRVQPGRLFRRDCAIWRRRFERSAITATSCTFLVARVLFYEGFIVLMLFTGVFASGILKWTPTMLIVQGLANSVAAAIAGFFAGWLDTRIGSKAATICFVAGCLLANLVLCSVTPEMAFFVPDRRGRDLDRRPVSHAAGQDLPGHPVLHRFRGNGRSGDGPVARWRRFRHPPMLNEFFGLFAMSGTATSFIGPAAIGVLTLVFNSQRIGVAVGLVFLVAGLAVMFKVREEPTRWLKTRKPSIAGRLREGSSGIRPTDAPPQPPGD